MNAPVLYGLGYHPMGNHPMGDITLTDVLFPAYGVGRRVGQKVGQKVDQYIDAKAARAAGIVQQRVEKAVSQTAKGVGAFVAGGLLVGAIGGAIYFYRRSHNEHGGRR